MSGVVAGTAATSALGPYLLGAAGISGGSSILSGILGSSGSTQAGLDQSGLQVGGLEALLSGAQTATNALSPYYTGGLENYDILQYLMSGTTPSYSNSAMTGVGGLNLPANATPSQIDAQISNLQQQIAGWEGGSNVSAQSKYAGTLADMQNELAQLQQLQQQSQATGAATNAIGSLGLPAGYFTQAEQTPFSYNPSTDPAYTGAMGIASQEIAAQQAQGGGFGSGNMASALQNEALTMEPEYQTQALNTYQQNYINTPQQLYNMLTGNTAGAGGTTAQNVANIATGSGANVSQQLGGIGNTLAQSQLGSTNALTSALSGVGNTAMTGLNTYSNMSSEANLAAILQQYLGGGSGSGQQGLNYIFPTG